MAKFRITYTSAKEKDVQADDWQIVSDFVVFVVKSGTESVFSVKMASVFSIERVEE